ncbi:hypothetical protein BZM27_53690 [Paraburkholderia steynii]|uniref:Uncharacterized protein n=1 Tax=Paraburkholderia steynii TaxID=1245441 RepID=A0A4V2NFX0_9BURK|nr:hypothetical protein BZM27_53690 [Paraburkholderia steynii]
MPTPRSFMRALDTDRVAVERRHETLVCDLQRTDFVTQETGEVCWDVIDDAHTFSQAEER